MQSLRLLLLLHVGVTAALFLVLLLVVLGQRLRVTVASRLARPAAAVPAQGAAVPAQGAAVPAQSEPVAVPLAGASVLDWTVDLRGVGQREAALRT